MPITTSSTKTRLGEFFRSRLDTSELPAFLNNADRDTQPPYIVVTITKMEETTPKSQVFVADVKIAIITDIDETSSKEHDELLESVYDKLSDMPRQIVDGPNIRMFGWTILYSETVQKDEAQSMSDVITIKAGCGG